MGSARKQAPRKTARWPQRLFVAVMSMVAFAVPAAPATATELPIQPETGQSVEYPPGSSYVPGEVLVRYAVGTDAEERAEVRESVEADVEQRLLVPRVELLDLPPGVTVAEAVTELEQQPDVLYAEPNALRETFAVTPNDTLWSNSGLYGLRLASVDEAWEYTTGDAGVTVAVLDTGLDYTHSDISPNLWQNPGETDNGIDDDGNGKVDDVSAGTSSPTPSSPTIATTARTAPTSPARWPPRETTASVSLALIGTRASFEACTSPLTLADLQAGGHTVKVRASDEAGNESVAQRAFTIAAPPATGPTGPGPSPGTSTPGQTPTPVRSVTPRPSMPTAPAATSPARAARVIAQALGGLGGAILGQGRLVLPYTTSKAGTLTVTVTYQPPRPPRAKRAPKPIIVMSGSARFATSGAARPPLALTSRGRTTLNAFRLRGRQRAVPVRIVVSFRPAGAKRAAVSRRSGTFRLPSRSS